MPTKEALIQSILTILDTLEKADKDPTGEIVRALREMDNKLGELVEFVEAGYSWEI